eukprot:m.195790 g.195790  ORF g.195790 m.195790 type:complete len:525 (+) comp15460_c7_seq9:922-2496(+)
MELIFSPFFFSADCKKPITGDYVKADTAVLHPECFVCNGCRKSLGAGGFAVRGGKRLCQSCLKGICFACDAPVPDSKRNFIEDKCFHLGCMACRRCATPLHRGGGKILKNTLLCAKHYDEQMGGETFNPAEGCAKCGQKITSKVLMAMKKQWHRECFACGHCQQPLTAEFYELDDVPYCRKDFQELFGLTCAACDEPIPGKYFQVNEKKFHEHCITCAICSLALKPGEAVFMPGKKVRVHTGCIRCAGCSTSFGPRDPCFMRADEPVAFCVDCKRNTKGLVLQQLSGAVVMSALEASSQQPQAKAQAQQAGAARQLYPTPAGLQPVASASEMAEFGSKMKLLNEVMVEEDAKYAGKGALPPAAPAPAKAKKLLKKDSGWVATLDQESGDVYFVNTITGDTTWDTPEDFGGKVVDSYGEAIAVDEAAKILAKLGFEPDLPASNGSAEAQLEPLQRPPEKSSLSLEVLRFHMVTPLSTVHLDHLKLEVNIPSLSFCNTACLQIFFFGPAQQKKKKKKSFFYFCFRG